MLTASEILQRVKERTGRLARVHLNEELGATDADDYLLTGWLQDALVRVAETGRLEGTIAWETEAGVADYLVPDGIRRVREVWLAGARLCQADGLRTHEASTATGVATGWGLHAGRLWLNRTPAEDGTPLLLHVVYGEGYPVEAAQDLLPWTPGEFRESITAFVMSEWLALVGGGAAVAALVRKGRQDFEEGLERHRGVQDHARVFTRTYKPL